MSIVLLSIIILLFIINNINFYVWQFVMFHCEDKKINF